MRRNLKKEQEADGERQADGADARGEDIPVDPAPTEGLPTVTNIEVDEAERKATKAGGKGLDKALEILDEYERGVPPRNPHVQNYEE